MSNIAIKVDKLSKCYHVYDQPHDRLKQSIYPQLRRLAGRAPKQYFREFWALQDVSFEVKKGETVGIIGRNGSGKSTLLQLICGTLNPTGGTVQTNGRIAALLELGSGFNPEFTGRENVYMNALVLGLSKDEIDTRFDDIVAFADIGDFIEQPVKTYSSGMFVRLAFAVQAHIDASIVIIDEALAVGDVFFRQKCYARLEKFRNSGAAILLVSHSMPDIEQFCECAVLLDRGNPVFIGPAKQASKHYYMLHQEGAGNRQAKPNKPDSNLLGNYVDCRSVFAGFPIEAALDLSRKPQVTNGQANCLNIAICNQFNEPCNSFRQGDAVVFYSEFHLNDDIDVPVFGIVITNDRGIIVHGKNSWQADSDVPEHLYAGDIVLCKQKIELALAPGEYTFEIGFASVSEETWRNRKMISHAELAIKATRICSIADVGAFSVGHALKNNVAILTHHGVADLAGEIEIRASRKTHAL